MSSSCLFPSFIAQIILSGPGLGQEPMILLATCEITLRAKKNTWRVMPHLPGKEDPLSPRFRAFAVTLPGIAGGEYLPFPRSKGGAFPFLLNLGGYPTAPSNFARGHGVLRDPSPLRLTCYVSPHITEGLPWRKEYSCQRRTRDIKLTTLFTIE
jgi:hypothetical protein